jgi:hypothetical protein
LHGLLLLLLAQFTTRYFGYYNISRFIPVMDMANHRWGGGTQEGREGGGGGRVCGEAGRRVERKEREVKGGGGEEGLGD